MTAIDHGPLALDVRGPLVSPLGAARVWRELSPQEAADRAGLELDDVRALEENRLWRFASVADAIAAALVYSTALGVSHGEARVLAGHVPPAPEQMPEPWSLRRWLTLAGFTVACAFVLWLVLVSARPLEKPVVPAAARARANGPALPAPGKIRVDVYNGTHRANAAEGVANRVARLRYRLGVVGEALDRGYPETRVYYPPGGEPIARRLARQLGVVATALPGGDDPRRLVVVVGSRN
jgi:LytR cell envelope-related transcriptional attenuator